MAEMDVTQIITNLKQRFTESHQFVFWYDAQGEFQEEIATIQEALLGTAQVIILRMGHQLRIKQQLLNLDPNEKALIYSPEPQPALLEDHLRNISLYSGIFTADSQEILRKELKLPVSLRSFIQEHQKFFDSKERRKRFNIYDVQSYLVVPELAIMAAITRLKQPVVDFFDVLQLVLAAGITENQFISEFNRYQVSDRFWLEIKTRFGYTATQPSLEEFVTGLYVTTAYQQMNRHIPTNLADSDLTANLANVQTFMQQFGGRNQGKQPDHFKQLAKQVWLIVNGQTLFATVKMDDIAKSDVFPQFDEMILLWIQDRLQQMDVTAQLNGQSIEQLTKQRVDTTHYAGEDYQDRYQMMRKAWYLVRDIQPKVAVGQDKLIEHYLKIGYRIDTDYRKFIRDYQKIETPDLYEITKKLVDRLYVDQWLTPSIQTWTTSLDFKQVDSAHLQRQFYRNFIATKQNRIVVIISDAFRFEAAKELEKQLTQSDQVTKLNMDYLITGLPSVTYMGMPAMLPHHQLDLIDRTLQVDGQSATNREQRAAILQQRNENSAAYALDDLKNMPSAEIRKKFAGKEVVYIYHNQIDTTADNPKSEDSTFQATDEAITEIRHMIERLRTLSVAHVLVTADHGYIYRDDQLTDADKIDVEKLSDDVKSQRYFITNRERQIPGVNCQKLGDVLDNQDERFVYYPQTANVFRAPGGVNYVHGGASLQEMLVPVLDVHTTSNRSLAHDVKLELVNASKRITSLTVPIVVRQSEPIGATVIPAEFNLYFVDSKNRHISGLIAVNANSQSDEVRDRIQHAEIILADRHYDKTDHYNLVIENKNNSQEKQMIPFIMDIADLSDFDF